MINEITSTLTDASAIDYAELINIIISTIISIIGFAVTIFATKKNIKTEIEKRNSKKFLDSFAGIEYDLAEILQLCLIEKLNIEKENYFEIKKYFPYYIVINRSEEYNNTNDCGERIYKLCGYITSFGSKDSRELFCMLQEEYHKEESTNNTSANKKEELEKLIAIIALLFSQMKYDATDKYISYIEWINIRLPIYDNKENIYKHCLQIIDDKDLKDIKKLEEKGEK